MDRDISQQFKAVRHDVDASQRRRRRTIGQALGFVEQTEVETGASNRNVDESGSGLPPGRLIRQESLALPEPAERRARVADVCEGPGRVAERVRQVVGDVRGPQRLDLALDQRVGLRPVSFDEMELARPMVGHGARVAMRYGLGESDHSASWGSASANRPR
jgi:hypothetical protein